MPDAIGARYRLLGMIAAGVLAVGSCSSSPAPSASVPPPASVLPSASVPPSATVLPSATVGRTASPTSQPPTPAPSDSTRVAGWRSNLSALLPAMDRVHPKLDHGTPRDQLAAAVANLSERVPELTDDEVLVGMLRIVAMVSAMGCDAHTGMYIWGIGTYPVDSLPLRLWLFDEGLFIVDALPPYTDLIGSRVDAIEGRATSEVIEAVDPLIPQDNVATVRLVMPRFLLMPQVLRGLGLADAGAVDLRVRPTDGAARDVPVQPITMAAYNAWAGAYGLHLPQSSKPVPYLSRIDAALWWQRLDDGATIFVQYNRVDRLPSSMFHDLRRVLTAPAVTKVVLDLRHNYGGEVSALEPMVEVARDPAVDRPGRFFVITGRNTYSAASLLMARLDHETSAIVVGEPMGGCPTAYGDPTDLPLPYAGLVVSVSELLEVGVASDDVRPTIDPDLPARLTPEAWASGTDPALDAIAAFQP
jgi:hypothetical protein